MSLSAVSFGQIIDVANEDSILALIDKVSALEVIEDHLSVAISAAVTVAIYHAFVLSDFSLYSTVRNVTYNKTTLMIDNTASGVREDTFAILIGSVVVEGHVGVSIYLSVVGMLVSTACSSSGYVGHTGERGGS